MDIQKTDLKFLLNIRKLNNNTSLGATFPAKITKKIELKEGFYKCYYDKKEKIIKIILEDIL